MRVLDLLVDVARQPMYHTIVAEVDGWTSELVGTEPVGGGDVMLTIELPEGYEVMPSEPSTEMLFAALDKLSIPNALARNLWAVMSEAHREAEPI